MGVDMKDEIMRYVSYDQILRYLHHNETIEIDASMKVMIQEALDEALSLSTFKHFFQYEPITIKSSSITLTKGSMLFKSKELSDFIHEAKALVLAGVTLGHGIGKRIENRMLIKPSYGIILDACASVLTDAFCDYLQDQWIQTHAFEEKFISQRYSPGYGDFEITENKKIAERLNIDKKIGVFTTEQEIGRAHV